MIHCTERKKRYCVDVLGMLEKAVIWQLDKYRIRVYVFQIFFKQVY